MTPERAAAIVARWVRRYTRALPEPVARRRIDEVDADLHDHIAHERAAGTADRRIALGVAGRMVRGVPADMSWRKKELPMSKTTTRSVLRVTLVTALVLLIPLVGMLVGDGTDWSVADFVLAGVLLMGTGGLLELAVRRPASLVLRVLALAIAAAAIAAGEADDAPGLVLFGCVVILGTIALSVRTAQRRG